MSPNGERVGVRSGRFWEYDLPGGWSVLAGRAEEDNDLLSIRIAGADDWWFHAKALPGSHVILRAREGEEAGRATREMAAAVAAYHSKGRSATVVPVSCTRARHVTKSRGSPPGQVTIERETTLKVRPGIPHPGRPVSLSS